MTPSRLLPILQRPDDAIIAWHGGRRVEVGTFRQQVLALADQLPPARHVLNLCADRYLFLLSFCACLVRGQITLMAPNRLPATQSDLAARYPETVVLHDGQTLAPGLVAQSISVPDRRLAGVLPELEPEAIAVVCFTSGSTGQSTATPKPWRTLAISNTINRDGILEHFENHHSLLATVPPQHMYGMETSILLPLLADVAIHPGHPLFPADVRQALEQSPPPRILVSTPPHLRALNASGLSFPPCDLIVSATAPLDRETALAASQAFSAQVREVYGCSEVGCIARRNPVHTTAWRPFEVFRFDQREDSVAIDADHLSQPVPLQDRFEFLDDGRFELRGRVADLVNIAGKRGSLSELTALLQSHPEVVDAAVFDPESADGRLAALVVAPGCQARALSDFMRAKVDPVFVPRPLLKVEALPRAGSGKLPRASLIEAFTRARAARNKKA